jgi:uncharacterized protein (UPF0332 family)
LSLHLDLLEQARHLALREPQKPRQASLRRAVSAAYYAMFHMLAAVGASRLAPTSPRGLRLQVRRAFAHADMKKVCKSFANGRLASLPENTRHLVVDPIEREIQFLADQFVQLQEARHSADYDLFPSFTRTEALQQIASAEQAFSGWNKVRQCPNASVFLAALMLQAHWSR